MKDLLKAALMSQDYSKETAEKITNDPDYDLSDDPITHVIVWAIESEQEISNAPFVGEDFNDYLSRVSTNFDYAIHQLRRAQEAVDKYRKKT